MRVRVNAAAAQRMTHAGQEFKFDRRPAGSTLKRQLINVALRQRGDVRLEKSIHAHGDGVKSLYYVKARNPAVER